jgi:DNA-binding winged helix-turn-helix (wHTH) protein/Tol biopolymer transport system component
VSFAGLYRFEEFELDLSRRTFARDGALLPLSPKAFEVLTHLVANPGRVVTKEELLKAVWPNSFVEEANLSQQIYSLRKALSDRAACIVTIPGRGYQFTAKVQAQSASELAPERQAMEISGQRLREGTHLFVVQSALPAVEPMGKLTTEDHETKASSPEVAGVSPAESLGDGNGGILPSSRQQRHSFWQSIARLLAGAAVLFGLAFMGYKIAQRRSKPPFEHFTIQKVTANQHVALAAVSPDGSYLASVVEDAHGAQSLWVHHLPTGSERPILQDAAFKYLDIVFSEDGSYIYFRTVAQGQRPPQRGDLNRIPVFGGRPVRVVEDVDAPISFIKKGQRLCLYRQQESDYQFIDASLEGGDEHVLVTARTPFPLEAVCAPDGKRAVVEDNLGNVETLDFASGSKRMLISSATLGGSLYQLRWDPTGRWLLATLKKTSSLFLDQIVSLSYPGGVLRPITNDLSDYVGVSLTADAKTIATVKRDRNLEFEEFSLSEPTLMREHGPRGLRWFVWLGEDKILASDEQSALRAVDLRTDSDTRLTGKDHFFLQPALCTADKLVVSGVNPDGSTLSIYSIRLDGGMLTRMSPGPLDIFPECTSDGRWLFFTDNRDPAQPGLMRLSLQGEGKQKASTGWWFDLSSDGKLLATTSKGEFNAIPAPSRLEIFFTETLQKVQSLPFPTDADAWVAFSTDQKSIFYSVRKAGGSTIWRQPLDSTSPVKIATISGKVVEWIRPSPDGTKIGFISEAPRSSTVFLRDAR